ncbi:MAG: LptF/LptG family permease, partial [Rhodospirillaceae bacterium]
MILSRYLMKAFLVRFVVLLVGLVLFLQTLDLLATANDVMAGGGAPIDSLARYVALRAPSLVETVAPLAGLLGALTALVAMAMNSEILAMRAAGRSVLGLLAGLVGVGLALSILLFFFSEFIVVPANAELQDWKDTGYGAGTEVATDENSWIMEGNTIIRVGHVMREGTVLHDVRLFRQNDSSGVNDIFSIRLAIWENGGWSTVEMKRVGGDGEANDEDSLTWDT